MNNPSSVYLYYFCKSIIELCKNSEKETISRYIHIYIVNANL